MQNQQVGTEEVLAAGFQRPDRCLVDWTFVAYRAFEAGSPSMVHLLVQEAPRKRRKVEHRGKVLQPPARHERAVLHQIIHPMHSRRMATKEIRYATAHSFLKVIT